MAASDRDTRQAHLVNALRRSQAPLSARLLAEQVGVSQRTIRDYVAALNEGLDRPMIIADQRGYHLDDQVYWRLRSARATKQSRIDTPRRRLSALLRYFARRDHADLFALADLFHVSVPTLEADLSRVRAILREHQLVLRRDHDRIAIEGTERAKRRLLRSLLFSSDEGAGLDALTSARERPGSRMARLSKALTAALAEADLELNEYVRGELLVHLTVASERAKSGSALIGPGPPADADQRIGAGVRAVADAVRSVTGAALEDGEHGLLYSFLAANSRTRHDAGALEPDPPVLDLTRDAVAALTEQFGLEWPEERPLTPLALHLQHLLERARIGRQLDRPLGAGFKQAYPLLHEMALLFANALQTRTGLQIEPGEVDYLALHLGAQFQNQLEAGPPVSVTVVAPGLWELTPQLTERVDRATGGLGIVENTITDLTADLATITSDLIVSTSAAPAGLRIPFLRISPFCTDADAAAIREAVGAERERQRRQALRAAVVSMLDPALYRHRRHYPDAESAIREGADLLLAQGLVEPGFADDLLERERRSATSFGGHFAIPHSLYQDSLRTGVCVLACDEPVLWGESDVQLIVMFAIAPDGMAVFRRVLEALIAALAEPSDVDQLIAASGSIESFSAKLLELLG
ncbi:PTS sugar transporter subunit IIA [Micropruina sp.]|uniref:BglG family transcription antiterminator n=1 Tax=Micropruina sp. TaxID=2737536 RepID=UPI00261C5658|nr:PTS sugar transporter subunit IIA [Micropruina sp.]